MSIIVPCSFYFYCFSLSKGKGDENMVQSMGEAFGEWLQSLLCTRNFFQKFNVRASERGCRWSDYPLWDYLWRTRNYFVASSYSLFFNGKNLVYQELLGEQLQTICYYWFYGCVWATTLHWVLTACSSHASPLAALPSNELEVVQHVCHVSLKKNRGHLKLSILRDFLHFHLQNI